MAADLPDARVHTDMKHAKIRIGLLPAALAFVALTGCGGPKRTGDLTPGQSRPELLEVQIGRLVDIYAYQRIDTNDGDRRKRFNRQLELVARNVVVNAGIESQPLFDAGGAEVASTNYEFQSFDKSVGHEQLVVLWDNRDGPEKARFDAAFAASQQGLTQLPASYRGQNTQSRPIPIVPRNAAIQLVFSSPTNATEAFFTANPAAVQLLEFKGDPAVVPPADAFRILPYRVIPNGNKIILDTTILGGEAAGGFTVPGLPQSSDNVTANIRIAIPSRGAVISTFYVKEDPLPTQNGVDSSGRSSVIRDFRSGNLSDGVAGRLREPESPMIVASLGMGITNVDTVNNIVSLHKRSHFVPVRGRYPFVDGPLDTAGVPQGPLAAPTSQPLRSGDYLTQTIQVAMPDGSLETVDLRAEILQNMAVGTVIGDPNLPRLGLVENNQGGTDQGELVGTIDVKLASVFAGTDSLGRKHAFRSNSDLLGQDCVVAARYYDNVPFGGASSQGVSDRDWRWNFVRIDPVGSPPATPGGPVVGIDPAATVAVEFTKPMDLDQVDPTENLLITSSWLSSTQSFAAQTSDPKAMTRLVVPTRLSDLTGDGTVLRLQPQLGFTHFANGTEHYAVHVRLGTAGVTDLAGQPVEVFAADPVDSFSVNFQLNDTAEANLIGTKVYLFRAEDEDGSLPGSPDLFGQYRLIDGRLVGAAGVRFSRTADSQNLGSISRILRGECWFPGDATTTPPTPPSQLFPTNPVDAGNNPHPGQLYWQPNMFDTIAPPNVPQVYEYYQILTQNVGRVIEPHKPQGSRMQMRYVEDDFSLSNTQPSEFCLDVEQLYWAPFHEETVYYDVFDRYTMSLAHSRKRPDEHWSVQDVGNGPECILTCASMNSGLSLVFSENVLPGTSLVPVFEDKVYTINPNSIVHSSAQISYVPFPRFEQSYTWRDSRLVTVDAAGNVIGLGGAQNPGNGTLTTDDWTANMDSPWITSQPLPGFLENGGAQWVMDDGDFVGSRALDHDPIALPLLVDFKVFPDSAANGIATGLNSFQMALVGPPSFGFPAAPGGYYNLQGAGCPGTAPWPLVRVQASGGFEIVSNNEVTIDPANQLTAQTSYVKDAGLGNFTKALFAAPPGDGMLNWARADFARRISTMTFGFFDTVAPQRSQIVNFTSGSVTADQGFPAFLDTQRAEDLVVQMDPPLARQPAGTSVVVELRGAESFDRSNVLYNPSFSQFGQTADDTVGGRGNLLNANYACEAYRYETGTARVAAEGLTRYVTDDRAIDLRNSATGKLPRFINMRLVMTNNIDVTPALSPSLRSVSIVYRIVP